MSDIIPSESKSEFFILSDIDIQFFGKCGEVVAAAIEGKDIVFQSEHGGKSPRVNTGFIAMKSNEKVLNFWRQVRRVLLKDVESNGSAEEQQVVNQLLPKTNSIQAADERPITVQAGQLNHRRQRCLAVEAKSEFFGHFVGAGVTRLYSILPFKSKVRASSTSAPTVVVCEKIPGLFGTSPRSNLPVSSLSQSQRPRKFPSRKQVRSVCRDGAQAQDTDNRSPA